MNRFKGILDFINGLRSAWPLIISGLVLIASVIVGISNIGAVTVPLTIPLPIILAVSALALYPIAKFTQWMTSKRPIKLFPYAGLLWRPSRLRFQYPIPLCPHEECGCQVHFKADPSVEIRPISGPFLQAQGSYRFTYECPVHGILDDVPNLDRAELQMKARLIQTRYTIKSPNDKRSS